jgi:hypothetical protein
MARFVELFFTAMLVIAVVITWRRASTASPDDNATGTPNTRNVGRHATAVVPVDDD